MALKKAGPYKKYPAIIFDDTDIISCGVSNISREGKRGPTYYMLSIYRETTAQMYAIPTMDAANWYVNEIWKILQPRDVEHQPTKLEP